LSYRRSCRAAATALTPSRCAPPPRCRHRLATAKLPPTLHFRADATTAPPFVGWLLRCYRAAATASPPPSCRLPPKSRFRAAATTLPPPSCRQPRTVALPPPPLPPPPRRHLLVGCCVVVRRPIELTIVIGEESAMICW